MISIQGIYRTNSGYHANLEIVGESHRVVMQVPIHQEQIKVHLQASTLLKKFSPLGIAFSKDSFSKPFKLLETTRHPEGTLMTFKYVNEAGTWYIGLPENYYGDVYSDD